VTESEKIPGGGLFSAAPFWYDGFLFFQFSISEADFMGFDRDM